MIYIASMVGTPDLETPTLAPYCGDLFTAFQKLSALGYEGVELMIKQPGRLDGDHIRMLLAQNHLHLVGICTGHIFGEDHLGLVTSQLVINPLALERLKEVVDFAAVYFGMGTLVNIGRSRGVGGFGPESGDPGLRKGGHPGSGRLRCS